MVRYNEISESVDKEKIEKVLEYYFKITGTYSIGDDGLVSVQGYCIGKSNIITLSRLPVKFSKVSGDFEFRSGRLASLEGSPTEVGKTFDCSHHRLTSLFGAPLSVGTDFYCINNLLTDLKHSPLSIVASFYCYNNKLTSLDGLSESFTGDISLQYASDLPILRLLRCSSFTFHNIDNSDRQIVNKILAKYNGENFSRRNIIACQKELIDSGFEGNASW